MKYCSNCKKVFFSESDKCECGKKFARKLDLDSPVEVFRSSNDSTKAAERCLVDAQIPYSVSDGSGYSPSVGKLEGEVALLIPLAFLKKAVNVLSQGGVMDKPEWYDRLELPDDPEWKEMARGKQTAVRVASFIAFLFLIYLCVSGVDLLAEKIFGLIK